ncbi:hypothetical protein C2E20_6901 [Micractinium conductrix]|uniref:Uncharacterized protein n=1 Tax=Micractinium conductrix TaxID=554055 RepID=A0A2P6V6D5_9CHLO|nr:hypothetical protein C2E20_6901 [Micractinium conductrix]|eukprot:PSC69647.1 hypothetical protein C2E20_6901 [Micractinium conductrix]
MCTAVVTAAPCTLPAALDWRARQRQLGGTTAQTGSAASAGTAGAGASLSASSVSGAGRQMLVATGRVVAAAAVATLANQRRQARGAAAAAAPPAAAAAPARPWDPLGGLLQRQRQRQRQRSAGAAPSAAGARRRLSPLDLLLAPVAPLLRALAATNSRASQAGGSSNRYDMLLDMLGVLSEAPGVQGDGRYDPLRSLLQMAPAKGLPRYNFARSVLRGLAAAEPDAGSRSPFDMAAGLLQRVRAGELLPSGPSRFDPLWSLLHEATLLQEWSGAAPYDPVDSLSDWGPPPAGSVARYDAWKAPVAAVQQAEAQESKYEPLRAFLRDFSAPSGAQRYDPAADLRALAASDWQGPTGASPYCPMAAALDAAAGWAPPTGPSPYCPLSAAFTAEPPAKAARWDPLAWLLDGWAAGSGRWDVPEGVPAQHAGGGKSAAVGRSDNDGTLDFSFA